MITPKRFILFFMILWLTLSGCSPKDPLKDIRNYRSKAVYTATAPSLNPNDAESNLFVYIVLLNLEEIYDSIWDSYDAVFDLYDNCGTVEQFENLRYSEGFAAGDFDDVFDCNNFMWRCSDIYSGEYYTFPAYAREFAGYLYDCYELAEPCTWELDNIWVSLSDSEYGLSEYAINNLKDSVVRFEDSMYLLKQAIESLEPIRNWFESEWFQ